MHVNVTVTTDESVITVVGNVGEQNTEKSVHLLDYSRNRKISTVKLVRELSGFSLLEAKEAVEDFTFVYTQELGKAGVKFQRERCDSFWGGKPSAPNISVPTPEEVVQMFEDIGASVDLRYKSDDPDSLMSKVLGLIIEHVKK